MKNEVLLKEKKDKLFRHYQELLEEKRSLLDRIEYDLDEYFNKEEYEFYQKNNDLNYREKLLKKVEELKNLLKAISYDIKDLKDISDKVEGAIFSYERCVNKNDHDSCLSLYPFLEIERRKIEAHMEKIKEEEKKIDYFFTDG